MFVMYSNDRKNYNLNQVFFLQKHPEKEQLGNNPGF